MQMQRSGQSISTSASAADIAAAVALGRDGDNWSLSIENEREFLYVCAADRNGLLELEADSGDEHFEAEARLDDAQLRALFVAFLNQDPQWRSLCNWKKPPPPSSQKWRRSNRPEAPALFGIGFLALLFLTWNFPREWMPAALPSSLQEPKAWIVVWFVLALPGIIVAATLLKMRELRKAANWKQTLATITTSELVTERRERQGQEPLTVRLPAIAYQFDAGGRRYTARRISIGEIADDDPQTPVFLQRYPVGARVPVFYDPDDPQNCVLEREAPPGLQWVWGVVAVVGLIMLGVGCWMLFPDWIDRTLGPHLPEGARPHYVLFFGIATLLAVARLLFSHQQESEGGTIGGKLTAVALFAFLTWFFATK